MTESQPIKQVKSRLQFIDMARSIAIILMLEGHFVDTTLGKQYRRPEDISRFADWNYIVFDIWEYIRGFTSPMFLTITGVVFVYLLLGNEKETFFKNIRVKKGFKRIFELLFWGYLLQVYSFHVLQCIAIGIFIILSCYGLSRLFKFIPIWLFYLTAGTLLFTLYIPMQKLPIPWPQNAPQFIQNVFRNESKFSIFPIIPNLGFTMYGAFIGTMLYRFKNNVLTYKFQLALFLSGICIFFFSNPILNFINRYLLFNSFPKLYSIDWLYERVGMSLLILSILLLINILFGNRKNNLFLKMGQNTLTIFIIHFMVLYGSVIVIGINDFFNQKYNPLNPWQAFIGAVSFIGFHALLIKYIDFIKEKLRFILVPISKFWASIYKI
jgi:uncharacterized membrane protein